MGQGAHEAMNEASTGPWVTVASFPSVTDLALVEAEFRERGLDHRLRDALSVQVAPHMSAAMGGIRLEVPLHQREAAIDLLLDLGLHQMEASPVNPLLDGFDRWTKGWPLFGRMGPGKRFATMAALVFSVGGLLAWWATVHERDPLAGLDAGTWCVRTMQVDGRMVEVRTTGLRIRWAGCEEELGFTRSGTALFPGMGGRAVAAEWLREGDHVRITGADTMGDVFEGLYAVRLHPSRLELRSRRVALFAERDPFR